MTNDSGSLAALPTPVEAIRAIVSAASPIDCQKHSGVVARKVDRSLAGGSDRSDFQIQAFTLSESSLPKLHRSVSIGTMLVSDQR